MLVVLRGNAASGETTAARLLQARLDGPTAVLSQDHFRRDVYAEREQESLAVEMQRRVPKRANLIHTPSSTPDIDVMRSRKIKRPPLRLTTRLVPVSDGFLNLWTKYLLLPQARASPVRGAC